MHTLGPDRRHLIVSVNTMRSTILLLAFSLLPAVCQAQTVATKSDIPGTRNTSVVHYDDRFLFLARNYGDSRDFGGNTEPGFFVHSKAHDRWLRILQVSTKDAKLGKSQSDDPDENRRLMMSAVGWDFTAFADRGWIELPLKASSALAFPDKVEFDEQGDRYKLSFFTSWKIESAVTVLYVSRKDLTEQFEKSRR